MTRRIAAAVLSAVLAVSAMASAVPIQLAPAHKAKYSDGVKKQSAGNFAAALASFESIPVSDRSYDTRVHIASCKARLGRLLDAAAELEEIIKLAMEDKIPPAQRDAIVDTAKSDLDELVADTPRLTITTSERSKDLVVMLDNAAVAVPFDRAFDPGTHLVIAKRGGEEVFRRDVVLERKGKVSVEIDVPAPIVPPPHREEPLSDVPAPKSTTPVLGYIALGTGVAFAGLAVGGFIARGTAVDAYKAQCDTAAGCDPELRGPVKTWEAISFTSVALSAVSIGVGVYLVARPTPVSVSVGPTSFHLVARF